VSGLQDPLVSAPQCFGCCSFPVFDYDPSFVDSADRDFSDFWLSSENEEKNKMCLQSEWNVVTLGLVAKFIGW
jgi:hypothetical protein